MANQSKFQSTDSSKNNNKGGCRSIAEPPIPLEKSIRAYSKGECVSVEYHTNPAEATSNTYELTILIFKSGNSEEWLTWVKNVEHAAIGQNATTGPAKYALAKSLIEDRALQAFDNSARAKDPELFI